MLKIRIIKDCDEIHKEDNIVDYMLESESYIVHTTKCLLNNIFRNCVTGNDKDFDNEVFETITHKYILKIIEKGAPILFNAYNKINININFFYINLVVLRSGLQFLVDYAESHENTKCDINNLLQKIIKNSSIESATKILYERKKKCTSGYLDGYKIDLKNIPISHYWWNKD